MGVQGVSVRGYGVRGKSTSNTGVRGDSTSGIGVYGSATTAAGVFGTSTNYIGVDGVSTNYYGVVGSGGGVGVYGASSNYGVAGIGGTYGLYGNGSSYGLYAISYTGKGVYSSTGSGDGVYASASSGGRPFEGHTNANPAALYITNSSGNGADLTGSYIGSVSRSDTYPLVATDSSANDLFYVDGNGNVYYKGSLLHFTAVAGSSVVTSSTQATSPSIEETGTAHLAFGQANVYLSPSFARSVNANRGYQVFITPGGETRGLYVANKYTGGFTVREMYSGRSNITFDYHVYATTAAAPAAAATMSTNRPRAALIQPTVVNPVSAPRPPSIQRPND